MKTVLEIDTLLAHIGALPRDASGQVPISALMPIIRALKSDHTLALHLWQVGTPEARAVAVRIADHAVVDEVLLEAWVKDLDDWRITDAFAGHLVRPSAYAATKPFEWAGRKPLYERRAAFATIAQMAWAKGDFPDRLFAGFLPEIEAAATDDRLYVRKAVNWALRAIGRRNSALRSKAEATGLKLRACSDPTARWVGTHRMAELRA